jgi:hypothetical protein
MPAEVPRKLFEVAAGAVRHLAWYVGWTAGTAGPRDV